MNERACPSPEDVALFTAGALSEEAWRKTVRHLSECPACRRHAALLALSGEEALPRARLRAPLPRPATPRPSLRSGLLRAAAAAVVFGALGYALALMHPPPPVPEPHAPSPAASEPDAPSKPPKSPIARPVEPRMREEAPAPPRREPFLPPPREPREEPPAAAVAAPPPEPSPFLAVRDPQGIVEAIEVTTIAGLLSVVNEDSVQPLPSTSWVRPSQLLRSEQGGSFAMPGGAAVHVGREGEVAVAYSQSHLCYAVDVRRGEALVDLGAAPRIFFVASGPLGVGVRLQDSSGQIWLAAGEGALRAMPLDGSVAFRSPAGEGQTLSARQTLVLRPEGDAIEPAPESSPALRSRFPSLGAEARKPVPPPVPPSPIPTPAIEELVGALGGQSYRYRVAGRQLREGAWFSSGILLSSIDELSVVRRVNGASVHARRHTRPWDDLGSFRPGGREDRALQALRRAPPPHEQLETALGWTRGAPAVRQEFVREHACSVSVFAYDPALIRSDVELTLENAILEGRMDRPSQVSWDGLEGSLEVVSTRNDSKILRAVDRRRVPYALKGVAGVVLRRTFHLETVYEFYDHEKAKLVLPPEILKDLAR